MASFSFHETAESPLFLGIPCWNALHLRKGTMYALRKSFFHREVMEVVVSVEAHVISRRHRTLTAMYPHAAGDLTWKAVQD